MNEKLHALISKHKYLLLAVLLLLLFNGIVWLAVMNGGKLFDFRKTVTLVGVPKNIDPHIDDIYSIRTALAKTSKLRYATINSITSDQLRNSSVVFLFGDNAPVLQKSKEIISTYLKNGGSVIFMIDGIAIENKKPQKAKHELFDFFEKYGIILNQNLVVSETADVARFSTDKTSFAAPYPLWVKTKKDNLTFQWASSVTLLKSSNINNVLVSSEDNSWLQKENFYLAPNEIPIAPKDLQKSYSLVAQSKVNGGGYLLVIPTSRFVREQFLSNPSNVTFLTTIAQKYHNEQQTTQRKREALVLVVVVGMIMYPKIRKFVRARNA